MAIINFLRQLGAGKFDFPGIHHNNEVAGILIWRINGLVLAPENIGDLRRHAAQNFAARINHVPLPLTQRIFSVHNRSLHSMIIFKPAPKKGSGGADETRTRDLRRDRPAF